MSKYVYPQQERAVHLFSILSDLPPSFFLSPSLFGEKEDRREERSSLSLRPECLAVFKWRTRTCFCLPRQIHCGGRWASTHTHILTQDTDLCVLCFVSMQAGNQVISYGVSGSRASLWQPTQWARLLLDHCGDFFGIHSVPELIIEFLLLNVLPGLANDLMCTVSFLLKNRQIFRIIKIKMQL